MSQKEIDQLINMFTRLPGLGQRSARRAVLKLLSDKESCMIPLINIMQSVSEKTHLCNICGNLDSQSPCNICTDKQRTNNILCIVEDISDLWSLELGGIYTGMYHVLGGVLSAIDGIFPEQLNISSLISRLEK